jgi:hypothetical protein
MRNITPRHALAAFTLVTALATGAQASGPQSGKDSPIASFTDAPKPTGTPTQQALTAAGVFVLLGLTGAVRHHARKRRRAANKANETNPHLN